MRESSVTEMLSAVGTDSVVDRLASTSLGRVAFNGEPGPTIFPVRYALDGSAIVFRACPTLRGQMERGRMLTFQVDGYDTESTVAWNVCIQADWEEIGGLGYLETPVGFLDDQTAWNRSEESHWVRLQPSLIDLTTSG